MGDKIICDSCSTIHKIWLFECPECGLEANKTRLNAIIPHHEEKIRRTRNSNIILFCSFAYIGYVSYSIEKISKQGMYFLVPAMILGVIAITIEFLERKGNSTKEVNRAKELLEEE